MQLIKLARKTESKTDMARLLALLVCHVKGVKLAKSELEVLSFLIVYGIGKSTRELIIDSRILKTKKSLANTFSRLKRKKLLYWSRDNREYVIAPELNVKMEPMIGMMIKIDNR